MSETYFAGRTFEKIDFATEGVIGEEFEDCEFIGCNFESADLSHIVFSDCRFIGCNLSLARITGTSFRDVTFIDGKLLGLRFDGCSDFLFSVGFENCTLNLSSFYNLRLKETKFIKCLLRETDFTRADLTAAVFDNCDLSAAQFDNTNLEKADLRSSYNYALDPESNRIKKARFSSTGIAGLLQKYGIRID